ncbi:MAG: hypothetical protein HFI87_07370 [Bacilli bacterium]|nr:hypothetical protein [Bacilli bacterium]
MKINVKKVILMILSSIGIGLGCFASAVSLLTRNQFLEYFLLTLTYLTGIVLVRVRRKYPLMVEK